MTEELKKKLIEAGRQDLIDIYEISQSGFAGILFNGNIVDRRIYPNAIPILENKLLGIPESKDFDYYIISTDGYKESSLDFIVRNNNDIIKLIGLYCKEYKREFNNDSIKVDYNKKEVTFKYKEEWNSIDEWSDITWYLIKLYDPNVETELYPNARN